jgi:UDP-glucose 4-epimerase
MAMARYLVTGGCGFIGSHLIAALLKTGADVVVLDDLSTGRADRLPQDASLVRGDIRDAAVVHRAMAGCDACFHLAAIASVQRCQEEWALSHDVNLGGTVRIFEAARDHGNLPVIYASSAAVYGDAGNRPLSESTMPAPLSPYGSDKCGCELQAQAGGRAFGLPTIGLRFFNVFGPGQDPHSPYSGVVSRFAERLRQGRSVDIYGDGRQTRDYIYVGDVVRALILALPKASPTALVFNVCTGRSISIIEMAHHMFELCGREPAMRFCPPRPGDIRHSLGDAARAAAILGFHAETGFAAGLATTLRHMEQFEDMPG